MNQITVPSLSGLLTRQSVKWKTYDQEVLPAWIAEMDFSLAEPIRARLIAQILNDDLGYPQATPEELLREVADWMQREYAWKVNWNDAIVVPDVVRGVELAILTQTQPGDKIVVQTPSYPPLLQAVKDHGREVVEVQLLLQGAHWDLNVDGLEEAFASGATMMLFSSPNNPTGKVFSVEELETITILAAEYAVIVVSDEVHAPLVYDSKMHTPTASVSETAEALTITVTSPSKAFNIAGLRCAQMIIPAHDLRQPIEQLPVKMLKGSSILGITASTAALQDGAAWLKDAMALLHENRKVVTEFFHDHPVAQYVEPEASYLAWINLGDLPGGTTSHAQRFLDAKVALNPGESFGEAGKNHVRLNFATSPELMKEVLSRFSRVLDSTIRTT